MLTLSPTSTLPLPERLIELHIEVAAVEDPNSLQAGPLLATSGRFGALDHGLEPDLLVAAVHGQVSDNTGWTRRRSPRPGSTRT